MRSKEGIVSSVWLMLPRMFRSLVNVIGEFLFLCNGKLNLSFFLSLSEKKRYIYTLVPHHCDGQDNVVDPDPCVSVVAVAGLSSDI